VHAPITPQAGPCLPQGLARSATPAPTSGARPVHTIRDTRPADRATQEVGLYVGPRVDYLTAERNIFSTNLKRAIQDESSGEHNKIDHPSLQR
ncbi:MAG: hypothetical protein LAO07_18290, partial [Acidobacteriia bacterium]|nr:hypothetical protein [Terriglobia bacterium]